MNFRKNSVLIIGCGLAFLLMVGALVFLIRTQSTYRKHSSELTRTQNRLNALNNRNPYPSTENVLLSQQNLDVMKQKYDAVSDSLRRNQIETKSVEPARFAPLLEDAARRVFSKATESGISISDNLNLGFKDYAAGKLPPADPNSMKRLVLQLGAIEDLFMVMIDSKIQKIDAIARDKFETEVKEQPEDPNVRGRRRSSAVQSDDNAKDKQILGFPAVPSNTLYTTERFAIEFTGWEPSVRAVLNNLAKSKKSYVIVDVSFENMNHDIGKPVDMKAKLNELTSSMRAQSQPGVYQAGKSTVQDADLKSIAHEDRIVGGLDPIKTKVVLDLYQFTDIADAEAMP